MKTLHLGLRVADLGRSLDFYTAVGYEIVGEVPETDLGNLTMFEASRRRVRCHRICPRCVHIDPTVRRATVTAHLGHPGRVHG